MKGVIRSKDLLGWLHVQHSRGFGLLPAKSVVYNLADNGLPVPRNQNGQMQKL